MTALGTKYFRNGNSQGRTAPMLTQPAKQFWNALMSHQAERVGEFPSLLTSTSGMPVGVRVSLAVSGSFAFC